MSFDTKKMIIATIVVGALFVLFLGYAFNSIQKVEMDIKVLDNEPIDTKLKNVANEIIDKFFVEYVDNISLQDIDMDILLVDHERESACIIKAQSAFAVDYEKLDKNIVYCNNYIVLADGKKTLIINCDEILDNATARAIAYAYHYEYTNTSNLSPESVEHFQTVEQDEETSFYRYAMIESAKNAYFNDDKLDSFYYYYDQWTYFKGTNQYQEVINYDYYYGLKAYVMSKVLADIDDGFSVEEYVDSYKNEYSIYSRDNEFEVMGLMWCLLMEKQGKDVLCDEDNRTEIYIMLLHGVPLGQVEENQLQNEYHEKFVKYIGFIDEIIEGHKEDMTTINPISPILTTETYEGAIKVEDNHYIYINYCARDNEKNLLQQEYVAVEILPYAMKFFFR